MVEISEHPDRWISKNFMDKYIKINATGPAGDELTEKFSFEISLLVSLKQGLEVPFNIVFGLLTLR